MDERIAMHDLGSSGRPALPFGSKQGTSLKLRESRAPGAWRWPKFDQSSCRLALGLAPFFGLADRSPET